MTALPVTQEPFPHLILDGHWDPDLLTEVLTEFPPVDDPGWRRYANDQERKLEGPPGLWGPRTRDLFKQIEAFTGPLAEAFTIPGLHMETVGGGYHCIAPGGHLSIHCDFNRSPNTRRHRRLNLLIYLNKGWRDPGGHLELWNSTGREHAIAPEFNRTVVFQTSDHSWHGHPNPASTWRRSVAAYFFTDDPPPGYREDHDTVWRAG